MKQQKQTVNNLQIWAMIKLRILNKALLKRKY